MLSQWLVLIVQNHKNGVDTVTPSHSAWSESLRGACEAPRRSSSARKIGAACNAFAEKAVKRSAEARSAEAKGKGEARRAETTWHSLHAEARRAEGRRPKGRG